MKKLFTLLLALMATTALWAHDFGVKGIYYNILADKTNEVEVTYRGSDYDSYDNEYFGSVTIPSSVTYNGTTYSVTSIGDYAFYDCSSLTSITIPNCVTSIGGYAFAYCSGLTSITIPNSVTSIGSNAFYHCSGLTSPVYNAHCFAYLPISYQGAYTIPEGIKQIAGAAFEYCKSLTSVTIPNSVTSIGGIAFYYCESLTSVVWNAKNCADFSDDSAPFYGVRSQITSFTFGDSVQHIPAYMCYGMINLTSITIPNSVTSIGDDAFHYCKSLTSIIVEDANSKYDSRDNCNAIIETATNTLIAGCQNTIIPNSVTSIGVGAFARCSSLTSVTIPNSVTSIGNGAFAECSSLTSITIPNCVTSIGGGAFYYCESLTSIIVEDANSKYDSRDNCNAIIETATNTLIAGCQNTIIPNSVTSIGGDAFVGCSSLTSITIPNSVTSIGGGAFFGCSSLTSVTLGDSVTSIGNYAFQGCSGLTSITIPNSVTSIGYDAFGHCSGLTSVTLGSSVTSIGELAFADTGIYNNEFNWENGVLYISNCLIEAKNDISGAYIIKEGTRLIADDAFDDCSGLTSITIPNSVTCIGDRAFYGCESLKSVIVPSHTKIGKDAFPSHTQIIRK